MRKNRKIFIIFFRKKNLPPSTFLLTNFRRKFVIKTPPEFPQEIRFNSPLFTMSEFLIIQTGMTGPLNFSHLTTTSKFARLSFSKVTKYGNGEFTPNFDQSVRGKHVYIVGTGSSTFDDVNANIMELAGLCDACQKGSAKSITLLLLYMPYSRSDKKEKGHSPIMGQLMLRFLTMAGADRLASFDLHAPQIQGFIPQPFDNLYAEKYLMAAIQKDFKLEQNRPLEDFCFEHDIAIKYHNSEQDKYLLIAPDSGAEKRVAGWADKLKISYSLLSKRRDHEGKIIAHVLRDSIELTGKTVFIVDDIGATFGTMHSTAGILKNLGAEKVIAVCTHGVFSGKAFAYLEQSEIDLVYTTNTLPQEENQKKSAKIKVVDLSEVICEYIYRCQHDLSVSEMFE